MLHIEWIGRDTACVRLTGVWRLHEALPSPHQVEEALAGRPDLRRIAVDASGVAAWDTGLVVFVLHVLRYAEHRGLLVDR
ncbi:MAG TPA: hypothetical protein VMG58_17890, partial [Candidatus Sulfotelmatobacter sp.]|nr:hypothetical protein [Candidatus Sulfotelmatobacter sp.]